ncbi:MAG: EamA family transporter [Bacteroidetes bacterium]|nr:EamA family transporter [Bacteroidota bacterium]
MTKRNKAFLSLAFICIIWGTTYLALRVAVVKFPALLFAAIRQVVSGVIILLIAKKMNPTVDLSRKNIKHQLLVGFLLITLGNGLVSWAEKYIPSGVAALICSLMPLIAVIFNLVRYREDHINFPIAIGMILGFGGVALIFKDDWSNLSNTKYLIGIVATFIATASWAIGSIINKKKSSPINPIFNAGLQVLLGGLLLLFFSPFMDNYATFDNFFQADVIISLLYLIVFGSVLAYTAYMFALRELPVGIVTLYAYVNPLVAVILGYLILHETLTIYTLLAFISIISGVYIVNWGYQRQHKKRDSLP